LPKASEGGRKRKLVDRTCPKIPKRETTKEKSILRGILVQQEGVVRGRGLPLKGGRTHKGPTGPDDKPMIPSSSQRNPERDVPLSKRRQRSEGGNMAAQHTAPDSRQPATQRKRKEQRVEGKGRGGQKGDKGRDSRKRNRKRGGYATLAGDEDPQRC